jgi:arginine-tRNA-protein transferase
MVEATFSEAYYDLYRRYITHRHMDGDMYPPSRDQFRSFLLSQWSDTQFLCSYLDDELVSVAVTDVQPRALSAIYTFFDPAHEKRSLGVNSILRQIAYCRSANIPYLYLGYWIRDCLKMSYKTDYRPVELFVNDRWVGLR